MKNLVTGGSGFLGFHLIKELLAMEETVISIDNFVTGDENNSQFFKGNNLFQFFFHDAVNPIDLDVDRIWHFACPASPLYYKNFPIKTSETCFIATFNMLNLAKKNNARILLASSSEVYGNPEVHPQKEDYKGAVNITGERSCYNEGKRIAESITFDYRRVYKTDVRIARIFNTYGPQMRLNDGRVVSNFITQALKDQPLTVFGDGSQTRSFCYVDDLIRGLIDLMNSDYPGPVNLGNNEECSIINLAKIIRNKINKDLKIEFSNACPDDPLRRNPSIQLAEKIINWEPKINLDIGLDKTISFFRSYF